MNPHGFRDWVPYTVSCRLMLQRPFRMVLLKESIYCDFVSLFTRQFASRVNSSGLSWGDVNSTIHGLPFS